MKKENSKIWIITDTHLGHANMVKYCGRPENHSELILVGLSVIEKGDTLIHLGDVCIGKDAEWHKELSSRLVGVRRILIRGNHDKQSDNWYLRNGWDFVSEGFRNHFFGQYIQFSHEPMKERTANINIHGHLHNNLDRVLRKEWVVEGEAERNEFVEWYDKKYHKLLAIEHTDYKPVLLEALLKSL